MNKKIKKILSKKNKTKIVSLTAYSKSIAKILDKHIDIVLVGDSMANVLYGRKNTHKISLENIIQHTVSVKMGIKKSLLVVDMPIGSYNTFKSAEKNAKLVIKKTGCDAIKLESNKKNYNIIEYLVKKKIPEFQYPPFLIIVFALFLLGFSRNCVTSFKLFFLLVTKYPN